MLTAAILGFVVVCAALGGLGFVYRRAQRTIAELQRQLAQANEAKRTQDHLLTQRSELDTIKDEFISTVSHELRTPLTSIRGALGLLSAGLLGSVDPKAQNLLRIAVTNTDRLIRLINDILDLERMESGRAPLHIRRCSLRELVRQSLDTMGAMAEVANVTLDSVLEVPQEAVFFDGDPDRILQVLTNLLSNAIKFSPAGATVTVYIGGDASSVMLRVTDAGRGIPASKLEAIFDRFQQVEASDARQKGGTGLGLAICRTIVLQHGGRIWAQGNEKAGASFCVEFPRNSRPMDNPPSSATTVMHGDATILVCDDDLGIRTVVCEHLRMHGYEILEAASGEHAIKLAMSRHVDAILLDLYMPGMSGWETLQQLKHTAATATIPVVILSVLSPASPVPDGNDITGSHLVTAAQGWVQKPFNENLLLAELSRVLHTGDGPAHVLLVEDDKDLAAVVMAGFTDANVQIDHAETRQQAIEHCLLAKPDLLILDLQLPDGDGFMLVDWLRQQPDLRTLPLVVYSGREVSDSEMTALRLGPTQFLTKAKVQPHEVEELVLNFVQRLHQPASGTKRDKA
jgi:signal transduction histidine kinase/DNA-binding response OmpR family regulator